MGELEGGHRRFRGCRNECLEISERLQSGGSRNTGQHFSTMNFGCQLCGIVEDHPVCPLPTPTAILFENVVSSHIGVQLGNTKL
jgi:hypothetical protein